MPKYKYPLVNQDDYKARILFTTIIETPPTIDTSAFEREANQGTVTGALNTLGNVFTAPIRGGTRTKGDTVRLYLPPGIQVQDGVSFDNAEMGIRGAGVVDGAMSGGSGSLADMASSTFGLGDIKAILGQIQSPEVARATAAGVASMNQKAQNVTNSALQTTLNPNIRAIFRSVNLREHSFTFKFIPRSAAEAQEVRSIIDWFRLELYPEPIKVRNLNVGYEFPNKFLIQMKYGVNSDIVTQLLPAHLITMSTNYNPTAMAFYGDGEMQEIDLTLNFREYRALDKQDIRAGFSELDNPDAVDAILGDIFYQPNYGPPGSSPAPSKSASKGYPPYVPANPAKVTRFLNSTEAGSPHYMETNYMNEAGDYKNNPPWGSTNPVKYNPYQDPKYMPEARFQNGDVYSNNTYDYDKGGPQ